MIEKWGDYTQPQPVWQGIPGFFNFQDVYDHVAARAKDGSVLVEIGCLLGRSACYLGEKLQARGIKATLLCIDVWPSTYIGPDGKRHIESPYETFYANVRQSGLNGIIIPLRCPSVRAASLVANELDFVFVDGDHSYEACLADIKAWLPKVRKGGIIAGHDYESNFPGVVKAINEVFGTKAVIRGHSWVVAV